VTEASTSELLKSKAGKAFGLRPQPFTPARLDFEAQDGSEAAEVQTPNVSRQGQCPSEAADRQILEGRLGDRSHTAKVERVVDTTSGYLWGRR